MNELLNLRSLAHTRTTLARASLFEKVAALWLDDCEMLTEASQLAMDDILVDLLQDVESAVRAKIAAGLAERNVVPMALIQKLAADPDISVSGPILAQCRHVSESQLLKISETMGSVHRQAMAKRETISPTLSTALCEKREMPVIKVLINNEGAKLSRKLFHDIVAMARDDEALRDGLLQRSDLPRDFAYRMFWWVSAAMRKTVLDKYPIEASSLDAILFDMLHDLAPQKISVAAPEFPPPRGCSVPALIQSLKSGDIRGFVQALARTAGVAPETAARIINDQGGECLAIASKAIGADRAQFTAIMLQLDFRRSGQSRPLTHIETVGRAYDAVSEPSARAVMAVWNAQFREAA